MVVAATLTEADVHRLASEAFTHAPDPWRAPEIHVRAAPNFEGEDALYVTAVFPDELGHPSVSQRVDVQIQLGDQLSSHGDQRFVYLSVLSRAEFIEMRDLEAEGPLDAA
jgi:hypothetical protein